MGCDIHSYEERRNAAGEWSAAAADSFTIEKEEGEEYEYLSMDMVYGDRNYALFGLLSDGVRCSWSESFGPAGFPDDASSEVRRIYENWGVDAHSASVLTLKEMKDKMVILLLGGLGGVAHSGGETRAISGLQDIISALEGSPEPDEGVRLVFWFDN